ncbi:hypothetical protein M409DRAFT_21363 [Zasmidium cellare ATCC 36951]|uniref:AA1-like domain-containing protein n=1 Tax=Zasmidium cellare ATCC 36951 TaxID=1080233 RepID=A0A6A6CMY7_ZASCE|nr:uncharacterized protein M409DRAFT_21363 [Zasmidium cellare ATCC 36951]KAF2168617.1 hypothetical protein M409DRAFT_21363 [Zasmidium cellare ATCC 36951]
MKSTIAALATLFALRAVHAIPVNETVLTEKGTWYIYYFADGCPASDPVDSDYINYSVSSETEYCEPVPFTQQKIHNVYAQGITGLYTVTLFSDEVCSNYDVIGQNFNEDGCYAVPADTSVLTLDVVSNS